jgi:hypothetical protein
MDIQAALAPESMSTSNVSSSNSASRKDNDLIPAKVVESAINGVANRINYGIDGGLKVGSVTLCGRLLTDGCICRISAFGDGRYKTSTIYPLV